MKSKICAKFIFFSALFSSLIFAQYPQMDFPLQIGNRWQYSDGPGYYSESRAIKDTTMPNGLNYTQIVGDLFSGFFRKEGTKVFSYNTSADSEYVKYDFSLKVGDTLQVIIQGTDTTLITVFDAGTETFFGSERNYMTFFRDDLPSTGDGGQVIADGLGFVQYFGEVLSYGLTGAVINGVQYGKIDEVQRLDKNIPTEYYLFQNYPNPFNPTTTINYSVPKTSFVTIKVYNVLGKEITSLVNEEKSPGNYKVEFNAGKLASGIYFYRIIAGASAGSATFVETKKLILLK